MRRAWVGARLGGRVRALVGVGFEGFGKRGDGERVLRLKKRGEGDMYGEMRRGSCERGRGFLVGAEGEQNGR